MKLFYVPMAFVFALSGVAYAGETPAPDNTKKNERDRDSKSVTPGDQGNNKADLAITKAIRQKVVAAKLSMNAKNAKIITISNVVTLRGPVASEEEKKTIAELAKSVEGVKQVDNQLEVAAN